MVRAEAQFLRDGRGAVVIGCGERAVPAVTIEPGTQLEFGNTCHTGTVQDFGRRSDLLVRIGDPGEDREVDEALVPKGERMGVPDGGPDQGSAQAGKAGASAAD